MSIDQTRLLGIEFERRVQTMIPETEIVSKLDTETIYSYLNLYQYKLIHDIYKALDNIPTPSKPSAYVLKLINPLLTVINKNVIGEDGEYSISLPEGLYLDSKTKVSNTYSYKNSKANGFIPNVLVSKEKAIELTTRPQDSMRIMRQPIAYIDTNNTLKVMYDRYTIPELCNISYYRVPRYMDLFKGENGCCELPIDAFEDIVSGAVDLYVLYAAGAEAKKRLIQELNNKQNKKLEDE